MEQQIRRFLELGLRLGRHFDELVDTYYGPEEIARLINQEEAREPAALVVDAQVLLDEAAGDSWLAGQARALWAHARKLAGQPLTYQEEGELVYGIAPRWHDETPFRAAASMLEEALPGTGDLRARLAHWYDETAIPADILEQALRDIAEELRRIVRREIGLPEGESFVLELVQGERWTGYARYQGNLKTRVSVNTDLSMPAAVLTGFVAHEIYGGHHTHHVWQDVELVRRRNELEWTLSLLWSPAAVLSEGIATAAPRLVAGDGHDLAAAVLERLGFTYDADVGARVGHAEQLLAGISANVAMLLHERGASTVEAREYLAAWSFRPDDRLDRLVANQASRRSPVYAHTYWQGRDLVDNYVRGDTKRLRALMTARVLPADLTPN